MPIQVAHIDLDKILEALIIAGLIALIKSVYKLIRSIKELETAVAGLQEDRIHNEEVHNTLVFAISAIFDKVFKGVENGRKDLAETCLNKLIYKLQPGNQKL